jgi:hypothetical protein
LKNFSPAHFGGCARFALTSASAHASKSFLLLPYRFSGASSAGAVRSSNPREPSP